MFKTCLAHFSATTALTQLQVSSSDRTCCLGSFLIVSVVALIPLAAPESACKKSTKPEGGLSVQWRTDLSKGQKQQWVSQTFKTLFLNLPICCFVLAPLAFFLDRRAPQILPVRPLLNQECPTCCRGSINSYAALIPRAASAAACGKSTAPFIPSACQEEYNS